VFRKPSFIGANIKNVVYPQVLKQIAEMPLFGEAIYQWQVRSSQARSQCGIAVLESAFFSILFLRLETLVAHTCKENPGCATIEMISRY
jgi:hypothetical protein